ncbi:MAG: histidine phosphatase family protein [Lachnospiraceae bacterium]|nr:histidine phosphatase family protein [Lachnospiraceae bacterium]
MKLSFIRHGLTEGNVRRLYYGSTDLPLLQEGIDELEKLREKEVYPEAAHYYTSGLLRTRQTLSALYGEVSYEELPGLQELHFGPFEMKTYEELKDNALYQEWISGDWERFVGPGGESYEIVDRRALEALQPLIAADEDAVCISHGGVIGGLMAHWFPEQGRRYEFTPGNGRGFAVQFENGKPVSYEPIPYRHNEEAEGENG